MARQLLLLILDIAVMATSLIACKKKQMETVVDVKPVEKPVIQLNRAAFPCVDSIRGIWQLYKYEVGGRTSFPDKEGHLIRWGVGADSIHFFKTTRSCTVFTISSYP